MEVGDIIFKILCPTGGLKVLYIMRGLRDIVKVNKKNNLVLVIISFKYATHMEEVSLAYKLKPIYRKFVDCNM